MTLLKKCQAFFHQIFERFQSAIATLVSQKCVIARTVSAENNLLSAGVLLKFT